MSESPNPWAKRQLPHIQGYRGEAGKGVHNEDTVRRQGEAAMALGFGKPMACLERLTDSGPDGRCERSPALNTSTERAALMSDAQPTLFDHAEQDPVEYRDLAAIGFPGYRVGSDGTVWTIKLKGGNDRTPGRRAAQWRLMSVHRNECGYCLVNLDSGGRNHVRFVHRLVLEAFVGPRPEGMEACHYPDPDKTNNRLSNLRWDTHAENAKDNYRDRGLVTEKRCRGCDVVKPLSEFYGDRRSTDGHGQRCRACHTRDTRERLQQNPEARAKRREYNRLYMRRWKAKKKGGGSG